MTIRHMKIFIMVHNCNSITHAAEELHLAQPAVTRAIKEIEVYYGVKLFDRMSRKLHITEMGKQFYKYAMHIIESFDEMELRMRNRDLFGELRIGSSVTIGNFILPDLIKKYKEKYPQVSTRVKVENSEMLQKALIANELDIVLLEGAILYEEIMSIPFMDDKLVLIVANDHPLAKKKNVHINELKQYNLILRESGSAVRGLIDSTLMLHEIKIQPIWESISTQVIVRAVRAGIGISILPYLMIRQDLKDKAISQVAIVDAEFERTFIMAYHKDKYLSPSLEAFMNILIDMHK